MSICSNFIKISSATQDVEEQPAFGELFVLDFLNKNFDPFFWEIY